MLVLTGSSDRCTTASAFVYVCIPMLHRPLAAALAALALALPSSASPPDRTNARLDLAPCRLEHPAKLLAVEAYCGTLAVPENYAAPEGRKIELFVARVPAINQRKQAEPLFIVAGGPGQPSTQFYSSVAPSFERAHRNRDLLIVDQRGTGRSQPLDCEFDDADLTDIDAERMKALTRECRDKLAVKADLTQYTTSAAVRDLDAVRQALGYARVSVYGVSYGSRVAQHYARRYPDRTRALILDGVVYPGLVLGPAMALDAEAALGRILARCAADKACAQAFGDPAEDYRALRTALAERPVSVSLPDPTSGTNKSLEFGRLHLSAVLRLASYTPEQAALLPLALKLARRDGNFVPLAAQFLMIGRGLEDTFYYGMHNSVVCAEDVPLVERSKLPLQALGETHMGSQQVEQLMGMCEEWPRGFVDAGLHEPLKSDAAALLLSGSDDPVTPPAYAEQAKKAFADSMHLVVAGFGHGQLTTPCVDRIIENFLDAGTARGLDVSCTKPLKPTPFFVSPAGPAP